MTRTKAKDGKYGQTKKRYQIMLTPTAWAELEARGRMMRLSRSELVEQFARGLLPQGEPDLSQQQAGELCAC